LKAHEGDTLNIAFATDDEAAANEVFEKLVATITE
jgi:hypothetical protein